MTHKELADLMGGPPEIINDIILGKKEITRIMATEIHEALGISSQFWLNLETAYPRRLAKQDTTVPILEDDT